MQKCDDNTLNGYTSHLGLYICGPMSQMKMKDNFNNYPNKAVNFVVMARTNTNNYTRVREVVNNMTIHRAEIYTASDLKSTVGRPIS